MNLNFKKKKIGCSFNDFTNSEFNNFIKKTNINNQLTLFTSQKTAKKILKEKIKIIYLKEKKSFFYNFLKIFTKTKNSSLQNFYFFDKIINENIFLKFLYLIKFILTRFGILLDLNLIRNFFYNCKSISENFDYILTDFRYNEVYTNHSVLNFAKKKKIPIIVILFSWDNLFSEDVNYFGDYYFVGSIKMAEILNQRHKIPLSKIFTFTSFQFLYLFKKIKTKIKIKKKQKYILYSLSTEENSRASDEEFNVINHIGKLLIKNKLNYKVYVRPYPFFEKKINFKNKILFPNIFIKDYGAIHVRRKINNNISYMRFEQNLKKKLQLLTGAALHVNFLSTIGIESVLLKKNTLFLNIEKTIFSNGLINFLKSYYFKSKFLDHWRIFEKENLFVKNYHELDDKIIYLLKNCKFTMSKNKFFKNFFLKNN
jgi:hypothetical protein